MGSVRWDGAWRPDLSMPDMRCTFGIDHPNPVKSWCGAAVTVRKAQEAPSLATPLSPCLPMTMLCAPQSLAGTFLHTASERLVHIVMSTLSVAFARELEQAHADTGIAYIAAPVMGRPHVAAAGKLNVLAAGDPTAIERVRPLLDAIGQRTWLLGVEPHQANVAKLAVNFLLASAIEAMAEAATLAERYEIDPAKLMEVITETLFAAPAYATYSKLIIQGEFKPGFKLTLGLKDIRLALAAGEAIGVPLPFASVVRDNLVDAIGHGDAGKDWSALALVARRRAGLGR